MQISPPFLKSIGILHRNEFEYLENEKKGRSKYLQCPFSYNYMTGKCTPMSFMQGVAKCLGGRVSVSHMDERIADGMSEMKKRLTQANAETLSLLPEDIQTICEEWDDILIARVRQGIAIPKRGYWNPRILEYFIALMCPQVQLHYFMEHK